CRRRCIRLWRKPPAPVVRCSRPMKRLLQAIVVASSVSCAMSFVVDGQHDWPTYGGSNDQTHYSPLKQINRANVTRLQVAWTFDTGDSFPGSEKQCNQRIIDGQL